MNYSRCGLTKGENALDFAVFDDWWRFLLRRFRILVAFATAWFVWSFHFNLLSISSPRYLNPLIQELCCWFCNWMGVSFLLVMHMTLHLLILKFSYHILDHSAIVDRSSCRVWQSLIVLISLYSTQSSAKNLVFDLFPKSFIYINRSLGNSWGHIGPIRVVMVYTYIDSF